MQTFENLCFKSQFDEQKERVGVAYIICWLLQVDS